MEAVSQMIQHYGEALCRSLESSERSVELRQFASHVLTGQERWFSSSRRGDLAKYEPVFATLRKALSSSGPPLLPTLKDGLLSFQKGPSLSREELMLFHPWRKGPLRLASHFIETEWRSDWKWERVEQSGLCLQGKTILDIGCGNGYHLWRMQMAGASLALGIDPYLPSVMQFLLMKAFASSPQSPWLLPLGVEDLPAQASCFELVFSMGILYHRKSPMDHLLHLRALTQPGGQILLETIVTPPEGPDCLVPEGRYAKMKNVWFLPSVSTLCGWLRKCRFRDITIINSTQTTPAEQRTTPWMPFESLSDYLDPHNPTLTIEGHPAPWRVLIAATV